MSESLFVDSEALEWRPSPYSGVDWKKLRYDKVTGRSAVLLRFQPGASYGTHRHPHGEEYFVLEGSIQDGARSYDAGTYVSHAHGSIHKPTSKVGCRLLVWMDEPIEDLEGC